MSAFQSINPKNGSLLADYEQLSDAATNASLERSYKVFHDWRQLSIAERSEYVAALGNKLTADANELAVLATDEMGKPLPQSIKELEKCARTCHYYSDHAAQMLADEVVKTEPNVKSYIAYRPLGPILCVMPWNFPYWQVIRFAVPAIAAGNSVLLKHAENTTGVALAVERLFLDAGFPAGLFQTLLIDHEQIQRVIANPIVRAVSLTGSERAGSAVAAQAGRYLKKTVLELGGSDPYIVLRDANLEVAAKICLEARFANSGQSCVAAKRFIVEAGVYDAFLQAFTAEVKALKVGDPRDSKTDIGPLSKPSIRDSVAQQVDATLSQGARLVFGGSKVPGPGTFYAPTILADVKPGMPAFDEEVFGPVASVIRAKDEREAMTLANATRYGLGGAIFSRDIARAERLAADELEAGFVAVNGMVQSDPRLPFGGVKISGYGRELSRVGLHEFVNTKTVVVRA